MINASPIQIYTAVGLLFLIYNIVIAYNMTYGFWEKTAGIILAIIGAIVWPITCIFYLASLYYSGVN